MRREIGTRQTGIIATAPHIAYNESVKLLSSLAAAFVLAVLPLVASHAQAPAPPGPPPSGKAKPAPLVTMQTTKGTIVFKLYPGVTPITTANFIKLVQKKFYDGLTFHRVEPGFVIQGGDPKGNGQGGPGYAIKNEDNGALRHNRGAVAMANSGLDTAGSQFYIVISKPAPFLDEKQGNVNKYTIFGQVISGQDVAEKIAIGDKMTKVTVTNP